jgi:extracellular factor (EF) 3-hydroxypalmitic acid methyl ester biosynthesis protein
MSEVATISPEFLRNRPALISCRNSQGLEIRATPLRFSRHSTVFEVYNPYSLLQLSEVLEGFRIMIGERCVYSGKAVVSKLVNTGIMLVCEVDLKDAWSDIDIFSPLADPIRLRQEFDGFLTEWEKTRTVSPEFKVVVADMETLLVDLKGWLEQVELGIRSSPFSAVDDMERHVLQELAPAVLPPVDTLFSRFELIARGLSEEAHPIHRAYMRRQLQPLILCAPFAYRTYQKPLGYAGDFEMVNMILGDPMQGGSLFARTVNYWFLMQPPAVAHRNRIEYLREHLVVETQRAADAGRRLRVMNMGCGPAAEIQRFLAEDPVADFADFTLCDFNEETVSFVEDRLTRLKHQYGRSTGLEFSKRSVHQILKQASGGRSPRGQYDLVYCAGLFDYLSDRICRRMMDYFYGLLSPGGLLIATNVDPSNPLRNGMEYLLEWHLTYRSEALMQSLYPEEADEDYITTKSDATGVNIYLEVRTPGG